MNWVDFILNLAALLLWINWRSGKASARVAPPRISLVSTLKAASQSQSRWMSLTGLALLLLIRPFFYWQIGSGVNWTPTIPLGPISLPFRGDFLDRMFLFSFLSFGFVLVVFHVWLLLLSIVNTRLPDSDPQQAFVRLQLGILDRLPLILRVLVPLVLCAALWSALAPLLSRISMTTPADSVRHLMEEGGVFGLRAYVSWQYPIAAILFLYLINSYVYLGAHSFWNYVNATARALLRPVAWLPLRVAKVDFSPIVGIALVFLLGKLGESGLELLYHKLPL